VFSALKQKTPLRLLTTDSEFHSFGRQLKRWEETGDITAVRLKADDILHDRETWLEKTQAEIHSGHYDVVFLSKVFFNSGLSLSSSDLTRLIKHAPSATTIIVDGYHAFAAIPTDLSSLEGRIFYLGGGYKYAQAGEGVGFLVVPQGAWRPIITGWFAEFAQLSAVTPGAVPYSQDGMAFWGATQDPTGWYRFNAVWDQWENLGESIPSLHEKVTQLQRHFIQTLQNGPHMLQHLRPLFNPDLSNHGHFLTFEAASEMAATTLRQELLQRQIYIDQRGNRLRFGFGVYLDLADVEALRKKISN
jgi:selenocysteine lyase/cysteine desulfurase